MHASINIEEYKSDKHLKLGDDTQDQIDGLQSEFAEIALEASKCLKNKYPDDPETAGKWLNEVMRGIQDEPLMVGAGVTAVSHDDLFKHLQTRWSFTNPTNLEKFIRKLQTAPSSLQEKIKKYMKKFKEFCHSFSLDGNTHLHFETLDGKQPCLIIEMPAIEQDLDEIWAFLQDVFGIYKRYFRIHKIEPGCIKVTLQFPADMQQLIQGCIDQKCDALKQHAISMQILKPHEMQDKENPSVDDKDESSVHDQDEPNQTDRNSPSYPSCRSSQSPTSRLETNRNSSPPLLTFDLDDHVIYIPCFNEEEKNEFQEIINSGYDSSNESDEEMIGFTNSDSSCHTSDFEEEMPPPLKRIRKENCKDVLVHNY